MNEINPYNLKLLYDKVLIKLPRAVNDEIVFSSGVRLFLDSKWQPAEHTVVNGEIISLPKKFMKLDQPGSGEWIPDLTSIKPGDKVIFDYFGAMLALGDIVHRNTDSKESSYLIWEGDYFILINFTEIFAVLTDEGFIPQNGWVIYEGVETETTFGVYTTKKLNTREGIVVSYGLPNLGYKDEKQFDTRGFSVGDKIFFKKDMYRKLEYDTHATQNKNLYLTQGRYINAYEPKTT